MFNYVSHITDDVHLALYYHSIGFLNRFHLMTEIRTVPYIKFNLNCHMKQLPDTSVSISADQRMVVSDLMPCSATCYNINTINSALHFMRLCLQPFVF